MSEIKDGLLYTKEDEWILVADGIATIGVTDYAQNSLSDIVYLELPSEGDSFDAEDTFGVVESVKAAADLFMPLSGEVTAVNEDLIDTPESLNSAPYDSWLIKVKLSDASQVDGLMDAAAYKAYLDSRD